MLLLVTFSLLVAFSILVRAAAATWSILLWRRLRDPRMGWLTAALCFLMLRQAAMLYEFAGDPHGVASRQVLGEIWAAGTTVLCVLTVWALGRMIADRDRINTELQRTKAMQQAILHANPDLMFRIRRDGTYLDYMAQDPSRLLVPPEGFLGRKLADVLPPDLARQSQEGLDAALSTGNPHTFEYHSARDPSRSWEVRTVASGPDEALAIVRDVTERLQAVESLRESESRFRTLADSAPVLIWMTDAEGNPTYYNRTWLRYTGRTLDEEIRGGWTGNLHPDDRDRCIRVHEEALAGRREFTLEYRFRRADGSYGWLLDRGIPRFTAPPHGTFAGYIGSAAEITAQKLAEEALAERESRLRTIIQSEPECLMLLDAEGRILEINPAGVSLLGAESPDALLGQHFYPIVAPESRDAMESLTGAVFQGREGCATFQIAGLDGRRRWLDTHAVPLRSPTGEITALLGISRDITARKEAEEALIESDSRFKRLANHGAVGIWEITTDGRTVYANSAMCRMLEIDSPEELSGHTFHRFFTPETLELMAVEHGRRKCGEPSSYEVEIVGARGGRRTAVISGAPLLPSDPGPLRTLVATFTDITERRRLEDELRQSEVFSRLIIETMPAGLAHVAADGRILRANAQAHKLLGLSVDELNNRIVADFATLTIHEDGTPFPAQEYPVSRALATGQPQPPVTIGVCRPDGRVSWAVFNASPLLDPATSTVTGAVVSFLDITDRKAGEEALRRTAATLRAIIQTSPLAIVTIDPEGTVLAWNPAAERIFGWSAAEVLGRPLPIVPGDEPPAFRLPAAQGAGGLQAGLELRRLRRDGSLVDVELWTAPQRDLGGRVVATMGIFADITERTRLQAELRESEDRYRRLVESAPIGLFVEQEGRFVYANPEALRIFGAAGPADLLGHEVSSREDAGFRPDFQGGSAPLTSPLDHRRFIRLDGSMIQVEVATTPTSFKGRTATQVVVRDITEQVHAQEERRAAEQRDSLLIEQTPLAVIVWDNERRVVEWNPAAERIFGHSVRDAVGRSIEFIVPEDLHGYIDRLWADLISGRGGTRSTNANITRNGDTILCEWYNAPLIGAGGRVIGVASLCQDVTETKLLEEELRRSQKMEAIGQLASGVAHDFGNLLTAIFGFTSLARRTLSPNHPATRSLDRVDEAAKQASGVTKALLTFSRGGASEKKPVRLGAIVDDAVRLLRRTLPANIEVRALLDGRRPVYVKADATQLQQVVLNLAINARDAMRSGGRLTIAVDSAEPGQNGNGQGHDARLARLTVSDTGTGMPPEVIARIFEPFFTTKPPGEGTGLGLAIIHGIVKDHGGAVQVRSEVGRGSTFTVTFPAAAPEPEVQSSRLPASIPAGKGELIILADSHAYIRELITSMLVSLGYQVIPCSDGAALLDLYAQNQGQARLVILDADMSGSSGRDCLARIRASGGDTMAILIAGQINPDPLTDDPRTQVLSKPFQMNELAAAVASALR